jgi:hypothetical protein
MDLGKRFVIVKFVEHNRYQVVCTGWLEFKHKENRWYCWFPTNPNDTVKLLKEHPRTFLDSMQGRVALHPLARAPFLSHYFKGKCILVIMRALKLLYFRNLHNPITIPSHIITSVDMLTCCVGSVIYIYIYIYIYFSAAFCKKRATRLLETRAKPLPRLY